MVFEVAEPPSLESLPGEYSPDSWDSAWANFEKAYIHARISYRLREAQGPKLISGIKEAVDAFTGGDGEPNCTYNGTTYFVAYSQGKTLAEEVLNDAPSRIGAIRTPSEEIHEQDLSELESFIQRIADSVDDLGFATESSYTARTTDSILEDLGEDHWDSDLARIVREEAVNKIERAVIYLHNGTSMLEYHLRIYHEVQLQARKDIYAHLLDSIDALMGIANDITADLNFNYTTFKEVIGQVTSAVAKGINPITRGLAVGDIIDSVTDDSNQAGGIQDPKELLTSFSASTDDIRNSFDAGISSSEAEISSFAAFLSEVPLSDLTLPEAGSVFH